MNKSDTRLDRLEKIVESLATKFGNMQTGPRRKTTEPMVCQHCKKKGHSKSNCFKLKFCYKCGKRGHVAKHCKESTKQEKNDIKDVSSGNTNLDNDATDTLGPAPRIILNLELGSTKLQCLYDP